MPIEHTLCGDLIYTSTFMSVAINENSTPLGYFAANLTHDLYTEDLALQGTTQSYTVKASFADYSQITSSAPDAKADILFKDPCPDPESVVMTLQTSPVDYYYTAQTPKMQFTLTPFVVSPPICSFTYSCSVTAGTRLDLCAIADGSTHGVFDPISGNYQFYSIDMANYLPGQYTFEITGTVGTKSASATFVMTLVDPCPTTTLTIIEPDPFADQTYILRAAQIDQIWNIDNLITKVTAVNCGALTVEFFNDDAG